MNLNIVARPGVASRPRRWETLLCAGLITPAILMAAGVGQAQASQLTAGQFTPYNPATAGSIVAGPEALYTVPVDSLQPTQENEGLTEVGKKAAGFDLDSPGAGLTNDLLTDIEPVVIGPGGVLYLTDGHHTFTALEDSIYGASDPDVYVNVIANYSNLTMAQFVATMEANNLLLPIDDGVFTGVNPSNLSPIPSSLTGLTSDVYRGLEYSILKNKSSKLFPSATNITGAIGAKTAGLDKMTGFYSDFFEADAYRDANGGLGLPYLSPGDIAIATDWNLNAASTTTLPNVSGTVTAAQLPGFILSQNIVNTGGITNTTLANGAMDGNGAFTGITSLNVGAASEPITIGTPNVGFIMQLGNDLAHTVTLDGTNSYTGGASILAGRLIIQSDASLGAAPTGGAIDTSNLKTSIQDANGIVFNSLTEGNGTLTFGTTTGGSLSTSRPIAVGGEVATIDVNANTVTLNGALYSLGADSIGIGNATGESDITFDDLTTGSTGVVILTANSPDFYGNVIIGNKGAPTLAISSDAELGNNVSANGPIGEVELNGGTLQTRGSFADTNRNLFLGGGSTIDVDGNATSWGTITDVQRTLTIKNSSGTAGSVTFNTLDISATTILQLASPGGGETVDFTNGIVRTGADGALVINPSSAGALGTTEIVDSGVGASTLVNGIAPVWLVTSTQGSGKGTYDFVTYGANGYVKATYNANTTALSSTTGSEVVNLSAAVTTGSGALVYALNTNAKNVTITDTLTVGDGTDPAGVIVGSGSSTNTISGGTLSFGTSQGIIWLGNTSTNTSTINSVIAGSGGLIFAGGGTVNLGAQETVTGGVTIDSGTVNLNTTNVFAADTAGIVMDNVKSNPGPSTLAVLFNNQISSIVQVGNNSAITISNGSVLTLGDSHNLSSVIQGSITDTTATAGAITLDGSGLFDFSAGKSSSINLLTGSTIIVNGSAQLRVAANEFANAGIGIVLNGTSQLQLAENGGDVLANTVSGTGELHLIGGTLQITGTSNTYSGGTVVELGSTLDITTNSLPAAHPNITDAGGLIVFDQNFSGAYSGVISDGLEMGTGPMESGSLDKDDSTDANGSGTGGLILTSAQAFTGKTYIEAGSISLDAVDTLKTSSGVDLGRVGGGSVASLDLGANNTIQALSSETGNTTQVQAGNYTLTIDSPSGGVALFSGTASGNGALVMEGSGVQGFGGTVVFDSTSVTGGDLVLTDGGTFTINTLAVSGGAFDVADGDLEVTTTANVSGGTLELDSGVIDPLTINVTSGGLVVTGGTLTAATVNMMGGAADFTGGTIDASQVNVSGGTLNVAGGALNASGVAVSSGGLEVTSGSATVSGSTTVSGGALAVAGGSYSTDGLTISGGSVTASGGAFSAGAITVSSGAVLVDGGALGSTSTTMNGGSLTVSGGSLASGPLMVAGGEVQVTGGTLTAPSLSLNSGLVDLTGGTLNGGVTTVAGGALLVTGGQFNATSTTINGGFVLLDAPGVFNSTVLTIGPNGEFIARGGAGTAGIATLNNSGVLDIRNGAATNVFTVGAYAGGAGSQLLVGVNPAGGTADRLVVSGATGSTQITLTNTTSSPALPFNAAGIPVVVSSTAMNPAAFTLANGPIPGGLFQFDLAYNAAGNQFDLIGAPTADAYRLASLPTAAQSIWFDTTDTWAGHQNDLRNAVSSLHPGDNATGGVWAKGVGDWSDRSQVQTYSDFNKSYSFQTGYAQATGGVFGGFDRDARLGDGGDLIAGFGGGYITSNQNFKDSPTLVTYKGPSVQVSAAYLNQGFFVEGTFKADFLGMSVSAPTLAPFGNARPTTNVTSFGGLGDAGYRITYGKGFFEPITSLAYVESQVKTFDLAGTQDHFGDNSELRGRIGLSGGATLVQDSDKVIEGALTGSYWDRLSGGSQVNIASPTGANPLTLIDPQVRHFGEVGATLNAISLKSGWSGFVKGDYQFATGYTGGDVKVGIRFQF